MEEIENQYICCMKIETISVERCLKTLSRAHDNLRDISPEHPDYEVFRAACVKEFELILELTGKLLRKKLKSFTDSPKRVDELIFKDVFRTAVFRNLISEEQCQNWLIYRDIRNSSAHDYGEEFAEETIKILTEFIKSTEQIIISLKKHGIA